MRTAIVTGASDGIGEAIAFSLARKGYCVLLTARRREPLVAARIKMVDAGIPETNLQIAELDVGSESSINRCLDEASSLGFQFDIVVNNAGLVAVPRSFDVSSIDLLSRSLQVNLMGAVYLTQKLLPGMRARRFGRVVNIGSTAAMYGPRGLLPYSVSKAALVAFTRSLALEVARSKVTVNCVSPGPVATLNYRRRRGESGISRRAESIPTGRLTDPAEVAELVGFLCADAAAQVTGQNIALDGGESAAGPYATMLIGRQALFENGD